MRPLLCAAADLALNKSGTVNLELALRGVPQVVAYRVSRPTAWVARHLLRFRVDHISPVNLVLGERLVPELLQDELTPEAVVEAALPLLNAAPARAGVLDLPAGPVTLRAEVAAAPPVGELMRLNRLRLRRLD